MLALASEDAYNGNIGNIGWFCCKEVVLMNLGSSLGFFAVQILNLVLVLGYLFLVILALVRLKHQALSSTAKAVWALIILLIPLIGAIVYLVFKPTEE
jgi:hypothetical protein